MNQIKTQLRNRMIVGGAIVFGVFAVATFSCFLFVNKEESPIILAVIYAVPAVGGAVAMTVGGVLYRKVSGKIVSKKEKPKKVKEVAKEKPEKVKVQKPKKPLKEFFGGLLGSLRKKAGKKVKEAKATKEETAQLTQAEELAQIEEAFQPEIQDEIQEPTKIEEVAAPSNDFFDEAIAEKEATEEVANLDEEVGEAIESAEIGESDKEKKEPEAEEDDAIELKPLDEADEASDELKDL